VTINPGRDGTSTGAELLYIVGEGERNLASCGSKEKKKGKKGLPLIGEGAEGLRTANEGSTSSLLLMRKGKGEKCGPSALAMAQKDTEGRKKASGSFFEKSREKIRDELKKRKNQTSSLLCTEREKKMHGDAVSAEELFERGAIATSSCREKAKG